jgi:hypothetical protein
VSCLRHKSEKYKIERAMICLVTVNSVEKAKQIHEDVDEIMKGLSVEDQEIVLKEAHNIVESLKRIEQITSKVKAQA